MAGRWDQRLCDGAVLAFAGWTIVSNATVLTGGSLEDLIQRAGALLFLAVVAFLALRARRGPNAPADPVAGDDESPPRSATGPSGSPIAPRLRVAVLVIAAALAGSLVPGAHHLALWWSACGLLLVCVLLELRNGGPSSASSTPSAFPSSTGRESVALLLLALFSSLVSIALHRYGADDAFYINLAVAAADAPSLPLLTRDTLHGLPEPYPVMPIYMLQSLELLTGALAHLTGVEAVRIAHLVIPALAAFLVPLAAARLLRHLAPSRWLAAVLVLTLIDLFVGDRPRGYGNFGLVHLYHGKAIFRAAGVALLIAYAIEYRRAPSPWTWSRLALAQAAAIGLTSSALWIAPSVAGLALLAPATRKGADLVRGTLVPIAAGVAASLYPIAAGLWLTTELEQAVTALGPRADDAQLFPIAFRDVLGHGPVAVLFAATLIGAWAAAPTRLAHRLALVFSIGFLALFWNPYTAPLLAGSVTGNATYWRVFWVLPLPILVALVVTAPLELRRRSPVAAILGTTALSLILVLGPTRPILSPDNRTRLTIPTIKFPPEELAATRALVDHTGPGLFVLAPEDISRWIPTLHGHPYPLMVRDAYLDAQVAQLGEEDILRRKLLTAIAGGAGTRNLPLTLADAVADYELSGLCLSREVKAGPQVRAALGSCGLSKVWESEHFVVWARR